MCAYEIVGRSSTAVSLKIKVLDGCVPQGAKTVSFVVKSLIQG